MLKQVFATFAITTLSCAAFAHDAPTREAQLKAMGADFDAIEITSQDLGNGLHVLFGFGGNILVSVGETGTLMVDDQFPELGGKIAAKLAEFGSNGVDFVVNTHWHFDHADGNLTLGPDGTWIVAHEKSRQMMMRDNPINLVSWTFQQEAYPAEALPTLTYDESMRFHWNGEAVDLMHAAPAHTEGDTAVIFTGSDVVHMGDVFNTSGYPFIDADNDGSLKGAIAFCRAVLARISDETVVIPGHGEVANGAKLREFVEMLEAVATRIEPMVKAGNSLEEVIAAKPTAEFDDVWGEPANFVNRAYTSLKQELAK